MTTTQPLTTKSPIVKALTALAQALMIFPQRLRVALDGTTIIMTCNREDMGRLVGESGNTVHAFRKLANEIGVRFILNEPERIGDERTATDSRLDELVLAYHQAVADSAEVLFSDDTIRVIGSRTRPATQQALAAIIFKIAKHSGQEGTLTYE